MTFGLTPGWWRFSDGHLRLDGSPLLDQAQWGTAFEGAGLELVELVAIGPGTDDQTVFVSRKNGSKNGVDLLVDGPGREAPADRDTLGYVRKVFAEILGFQVEELKEDVGFDEFGLDSLLAVDIVSRFEADLGPLPATILFEHNDLRSLASYFDRNYTARYGQELAVEDSTSAAKSDDYNIGQGSAWGPPARSGLDRDDAIAVVGVVGRYPGAPTVDDLWELVAAGESAVVEVPADRWDWRRYFDPDPHRPNRTNGRWAGFIDGVDQFDPRFFGILPRDAVNIDPQERLFLETAFELLETTGHLGPSRTRRVGVFVGAMYGSFGQLGATGWEQGHLAGPTSAYWSIANRVAHVFDLTGPSYAVDSACSSSLLAVHQACQSLRDGACDVAVAGGVNVILHPAHLIGLSALDMLSPDGRCWTFDERANGMVPGEGVGAVLLKPLRAAEPDGDRIWGVIRGSATNTGGRTNGYTVPSPSSQTQVILEALSRSRVDPESIGYVETHGTGTALGDPIELVALAEAMGSSRSNRIPVGSVKANVGHLEGAAGIVGLTKVLLQLNHQEIPPCAGLENLNSKIDRNRNPFDFPSVVEQWHQSDIDGHAVPRRAGVSSFGAGGTNVHLVVEEFESDRAPVSRSAASRQQAFLLSAQSPQALRLYARDLVAFLKKSPGVDLVALCGTSQLHRSVYRHRWAAVVGSTVELIGRLGRLAEGVDQQTVPSTPLDDKAHRWVEGHDVDWSTDWQNGPPMKVAYPAHPFDRSRYWPAFLDAHEPTGSVEEPMSKGLQPVASQRPGLNRYLRPTWVEDKLESNHADLGSVLLLATTGDQARQLKIAAANAGHHNPGAIRSVTVEHTDPSSWETAVAETLRNGLPRHLPFRSGYATVGRTRRGVAGRTTWSRPSLTGVEIRLPGRSVASPTSCAWLRNPGSTHGRRRCGRGFSVHRHGTLWLFRVCHPV